LIALGIDISGFTATDLNRACDLVENEKIASRISIIPPMEGYTRFEIVADEKMVVVDTNAIKKRLGEVLIYLAAKKAVEMA
jgi:hypothetical protein